MPRAPKPVYGVYEKNPGSRIWYIRYRINGKLVRKKIGTRQQAIDQLDKVRFLRTSGEGVVATSAKQYTRTKQELADFGEGGITIQKLGDEYLAYIQDENNPNRPSDQQNPPQRIHAIQAAFGDRPAASIKAYEISDWLRSLKRSPATLNRYRSTFSAMYRYAKERDKVKVNPVRDFSQFTVTLPKPRYTSERPEVICQLHYNHQMQIHEIIAALDSEIACLQQVKALLSGSTANGNVASASKTHRLSAEARAKISAAQRKRWAKMKKASK